MEAVETIFKDTLVAFFIPTAQNNVHGKVLDMNIKLFHEGLLCTTISLGWFEFGKLTTETTFTQIFDVFAGTFGIRLRRTHQQYYFDQLHYVRNVFVQVSRWPKEILQHASTV